MHRSNPSKLWLALPAAAALAAATAASGCGECTAMGCYDMVSITLDDAELSDGHWEVELSSPDTSSHVCELPIPLDTRAELVCSDGLYLAIPFDESATRRIDRIEVLLDGEPPAELTLSFRHDGADVASAVIEPSYDSFRPNGRGCEPTCQVASEALSLGFD